MSNGLPVVARSTVGSAKIVADAGAGIVVGSSDPEAWSDAIGTLLREADLWADMGRRGSDYAARSLSWTRSAADLLDFIQQVSSAVPRY